MDYDQLARELGRPATYPEATREAVARVVVQPVDNSDIFDIDATHERLQENLTYLLDQWLTGDPEYPIVEALTVTQLAVDFAAFALIVRDLTQLTPAAQLGDLVRFVDALESTGVASGDWSWCRHVAGHVLAEVRGIAAAANTTGPAN